MEMFSGSMGVEWEQQPRETRWIRFKQPRERNMRANKTKTRVIPLSTGIGLYGREPRSQIETSGSLSLYFLCAFYIKIKGELLLLLIPPSHLRKFNKKKKNKIIQRQVCCGHEKCVFGIPLSNQKQNHHFRLIVFLRILFNCAWKGLGKKI